MIYTIISTTYENRITKNKRDCRILRQPLSLLPIEISEYIEGTKNASVKAERLLAYTTLLCGLKIFFDIEDPIIKRTKDGKPFIENSKVYFNISHSDGAVAVCLCDEGEVGVDIQSEISEERAERLNKRFFTDLNIKKDDIQAEYYFLRLSEGEAVLEGIDLSESVDDGFTVKWAYAEALMKLQGGGFADAHAIREIAEGSLTEIKILETDKKYILAISTEGARK